ncbi:hypothetical protein SAMN05421504_105568 [Amycolatopsis xylanica]|uniref:Uncharacterized protein n=1 Tax=Amycolatopsis xylanica TaxID=589385 RepID=A0A1H3JXG3_9PSEU|nr:hypothetical protein SAMN05421504_105568 [Amycolatopsis xylanica]
MVEELYAGEPSAFITARNARAREAKTGGDPDLAERIRALRKPTAAAAVVNWLARAHPEALDELAALGERLRKAHAELDGAELRVLTRQRHELVARTLRLGPSLSDPVARDVEATLEAVVANPDAAEAAAEGNLTAALQPDAGDHWLTAATVKLPKRPKLKLVPKPVEKAPKKPRAEDPAAKQERERRRREAEELGKTRDKAHAELTRARRKADRAAEAAAALRERLAEAEKAKAEAGRAFDAAQAVYDAAQAAVDAH